MMRYRTQIVVVALFLLFGGTGCKSANQPEKTPTQNKTVTTKAETVPAPAQAETAQSPTGLTIKGKVLDTINAGAYTYLQVQAAQGPVWIAIPQAKVEKGQEVTVQNGMEMINFKSRILKRTFASIIFANGIDGNHTAGNMQQSGGPHAAAATKGGNGFAKALESETDQSATASMASSGGSLAAIVPSANVKVRKAEGANGYTIGELFAKRKELNNKEVRVRGKVMKVSRMIMGKNWVHIQDGTGDALKNTYELVVTTMAIPKKGAVVLVEGVLHADRDFGAGYRYDAIIEDAKILKQ